LYKLYEQVVINGEGNLLLNVAPDTSGQIPPAYIHRLMELRDSIDAM
jgi:alpha-L-fucosidase